MIIQGVVDVGIITPEWNDIIVVKMDYGKMPPHKRIELAESSLKKLKEMFPNNKIMMIDNKSDVTLCKSE